MRKRTEIVPCTDCGEPVERGPKGFPLCEPCCDDREIGQAKVIATASFQRRFWKKVEKSEGDCWMWTASVDGSGYGKILVDGRLVPSHRVSYILNVGEIPRDMMVGQSCDVHRCVNPSHLILISASDRVSLRYMDDNGRRIAKTHCEFGHPLSGDNVYVWDGQPNMRHCLTCRLDTRNRYEQRKRDARIEPGRFRRGRRQARLDYYRNRCWMCGDPAKTTDHVKPLSKGGLHVLSNIRPACKSCNPTKADRWPFSTSRVWLDLTEALGADEMRLVMVQFPTITRTEAAALIAGNRG